jgi:hypothetical protein
MAPKLVVWVSAIAGEASRALQTLKRHDEPVARNATVLIREPQGKVVVFESGNVDPRYWPLLGAVVGLFVGRLDRSDLAHTAPGSLAALQVAFPPGGSALVTLIDGEQVTGTLRILETFRGQAWEQALADDLLAQLTTGMAPEGR